MRPRRPDFHRPAAGRDDRRVSLGRLEPVHITTRMPYRGHDTATSGSRCPLPFIPAREETACPAPLPGARCGPPRVRGRRGELDGYRARGYRWQAVVRCGRPARRSTRRPAVPVRAGSLPSAATTTAAATFRPSTTSTPTSTSSVRTARQGCRKPPTTCARGFGPRTRGTRRRVVSGDDTSVNGPGPREKNRCGQIIRWTPADGDHAPDTGSTAPGSAMPLRHGRLLLTRSSRGEPAPDLALRL